MFMSTPNTLYFLTIFLNIFAVCLLPTLCYSLLIYNIITVGTFKVTLFVCFLLFVVLPLIYKHSYAFQRSAVFLNFFNIPPNADYTNPEKYGLKGSRNFYVSTDDNVKLGVWQVLPDNLADTNETDEDFFESILNNGQNVVIYNHGNGGARLTSHRVEIYGVLRKQFHVIAFDYRSFGDSSNVPPSELGIVNDCVAVYQWVRNRTNGHIFIWGHSLGTSVSSHALLKIQAMRVPKPLGLILEAPFNNIRDEIREFPMAKLFKYLPWFAYTVVEPMAKNFQFETEKYVCEVNVPIMILHAEDDGVIPYRLGYKLYEAAKKCRHRTQGFLIFHSFDGKHKFGHKFICRANDLPDKISDFVQEAVILAKSV